MDKKYEQKEVDRFYSGDAYLKEYGEYSKPGLPPVRKNLLIVDRETFDSLIENDNNEW